MPLISVEAMFKTIAEQDAHIKDLKERIAQLEIMLENQKRIKLAQDLIDLVNQYPDTLHYPIIASTDFH